MAMVDFGIKNPLLLSSSKKVATTNLTVFSLVLRQTVSKGMLQKCRARVTNVVTQRSM